MFDQATLERLAKLLPPIPADRYEPQPDEQGRYKSGWFWADMAYAGLERAKFYSDPRMNRPDLALKQMAEARRVLPNKPLGRAHLEWLDWEWVKAAKVYNAQAERYNADPRFIEQELKVELIEIPERYCH
tara:strand:- start:615 stop:1004 length:390 start_codon:yes stop_codon:yes gene_type:complete